MPFRQHPKHPSILHTQRAESCCVDRPNHGRVKSLTRSLLGRLLDMSNMGLMGHGSDADKIRSPPSAYEQSWQAEKSELARVHPGQPCGPTGEPPCNSSAPQLQRKAKASQPNWHQAFSTQASLSSIQRSSPRTLLAAGLAMTYIVPCRSKAGR